MAVFWSNPEGQHQRGDDDQAAADPEHPARSPPPRVPTRPSPRSRPSSSTRLLSRDRFIGLAPAGHRQDGRASRQRRRLDSQDRRPQPDRLPACFHRPIDLVIREASFRTDRQNPLAGSLETSRWKRFSSRPDERSSGEVRERPSTSESQDVGESSSINRSRRHCLDASTITLRSRSSLRRSGIDDRPLGDQRDQPGDPQLRRLLDQPVEPLALGDGPSRASSANDGVRSGPDGPSMASSARSRPTDATLAR